MRISDWSSDVCSSDLTVWQRRGTSWVWDEEARNQVCAADEVWSIRQFLRAAGKWPEDLPSNQNNTLVVAGLDGCLDLLNPNEAETWLGDTVKSAILSFQAHYERDRKSTRLNSSH